MGAPLWERCGAVGWVIRWGGGVTRRKAGRRLVALVVAGVEEVVGLGLLLVLLGLGLVLGDKLDLGAALHLGGAGQSALLHETLGFNEDLEALASRLVEGLVVERRSQVTGELELVALLFRLLALLLWREDGNVLLRVAASLSA